MADFNVKIEQKFTITLTLTELEARAMDALVGYGDEEFLKVFYTHMGKYYLEPYEKGLRSLFKSARNALPGVLSRIDEARKF